MYLWLPLITIFIPWLTITIARWLTLILPFSLPWHTKYTRLDLLWLPLSKPFGLPRLSTVAACPRLVILANISSAKTYLASGTPLLCQDTRYSKFGPLTLGTLGAGLPPLLAPGESGGTLAIQPYPERYWLHNLTPHAS